LKVGTSELIPEADINPEILEPYLEAARSLEKAISRNQA